MTWVLACHNMDLTRQGLLTLQFVGKITRRVLDTEQSREKHPDGLFTSFLHLLPSKYFYN